MPVVLGPNHIYRRMLVSALIGVAVTLLLPRWIDLEARILTGWCAYLLAALTLSWSLILHTNAERTRENARSVDPGRGGALLVTMLVSFASLASVVYVQTRAASGSLTHYRPYLAALSLINLFGGWALVHTAFTLHYSRMYYADDDSPGGIEFPGHRPPDELDFAYFGLGIGATFQTADVAITDFQIRRVVLVHSVVSFLYNVAIIAIAVSVIFGLF